MEMNKNSGSDFGFETPIYQEDLHNEEEQGPRPSLKPKQVFSSTMAHDRRDRLAALSLLILAAVLLIVDIGLGVHYNKITDNHLTTEDAMRIEKELSKLQNTYAATIKKTKDIRLQLQGEVDRRTPDDWELDHQRKRKEEYEVQIPQMTGAITSMKSQLPAVLAGCKHCPPGWILLNSQCFFFALSNIAGSKSWQKAREYCQRHSGDLVVLDTRDKVNSTVKVLMSHYVSSNNGFWTGLRYSPEEETWKWMDGKRLGEGFWNDGEPSDSSNSDTCAMVEVRENFFKSWSSAACTATRKWICEKEPSPIN